MIESEDLKLNLPSVPKSKEITNEIQTLDAKSESQINIELPYYCTKLLKSKRKRPKEEEKVILILPYI